jgi:hypothetical protein
MRDLRRTLAATVMLAAFVLYAAALPAAARAATQEGKSVAAPAPLKTLAAKAEGVKAAASEANKKLFALYDDGQLTEDAMEVLNGSLVAIFESAAAVQTSPTLKLSMELESGYHSLQCALKLVENEKAREALAAPVEKLGAAVDVLRDSLPDQSLALIGTADRTPMALKSDACP